MRVMWEPRERKPRLLPVSAGQVRLERGPYIVDREHINAAFHVRAKPTIFFHFLKHGFSGGGTSFKKKFVVGL